ncbi:LysR family transcriptional regulator [Paraglaciecola aquimarina]|uniref:LysR family transcriptional regulator n=1 Tax=Paraglaciecola algarum TaxID=3050085 RepID=A0ABS9D874_9ALTE|nr:LysR family transcriptional regulator [Paraglaciecola sp. G1-23]MCF2949130.1 LysR family transcriptional regulator [Paraglaciecola sp. G1-23]
MDIRFLITFMEVAETRHFGKAAENLYLTQSAVSARIKQLEEYFNSALFVRNRNSLQLTAAGEKLIPYAEQLAKTLNQARQALSDENVQQLSIACTPNAWDVYLKQNLTGLKNAFPEVAIKADVLTNEQLMRLVHEHAIDLAVTTIPFKSDDVETIELSSSKLALYQTKSLDMLDKAADNSQFIYMDWGKKYNEKIDKLYPGSRQAKLRTSSLQVALEYLADNAGAMILPEEFAQSILKQYELSKVSTLDSLEVKCYLIYLKEARETWLGELIEFLE